MDEANLESRWHNIDTAPRDGTVFLAKFMEGIVTLAWWNTKQKLPSDPFWFCGIPERYEVAPCVQPRYWQPFKSRSIKRRPFGVLVKHPKLCVNWHWPILVWKVRRYPTLTVCGFGPLEVVWPRRGYVLPESASGHSR